MDNTYLEPLRSNAAAMTVDMTSSTATNQAIKKIKTPKFIPFEPSRGAIGPKSLLRADSISEKPTAKRVLFPDSQLSNDVTTTLHRYKEVVYVPKAIKRADSKKRFSNPTLIRPNPNPPESTTSTTSTTLPVSSSSSSSIFKPERPVNVVDPIRSYKDTVVNLETDLEGEAYSDSRAVVHLQAVNDVCNQKIVQLRDERMELKKELELQFQINAELKKLLVASMGDDMHHDIEMLVRQRTQLSSEIDSYCKKIQDSNESMDKMNIMADMWRSKYIASRVMVDELASWKAQISVRYDESRCSLHNLLHERHVIRDHVAETTKYLQQIHSTFYQSGSRLPRMTSSNLLELSKQTSHMAETVKFKFLGSVPVTVQTINADDPTPAERVANEVLSNGSTHPDHHCNSHAIGRFHPDTRFELLTLNCCGHCKGEISVI